MTVLTGEMFADICETIWGPNWKSRAAQRLKRSERQLLKIEVGQSKVMPAVRRELLGVVREQIVLLQAHEREIAE